MHDQRVVTDPRRLDVQGSVGQGDADGGSGDGRGGGLHLCCLEELEHVPPALGALAEPVDLTAEFFDLGAQVLIALDLGGDGVAQVSGAVGAQILSTCGQGADHDHETCQRAHEGSDQASAGSGGTRATSGIPALVHAAQAYANVINPPQSITLGTRELEGASRG